MKIYIKNGKKPVSFNLKGIIKSKLSDPLYIWDPIAPEGYTFLGSYCTFSENLPLIDQCPIRAIPNQCLQEIAVNSNDIIQSGGIDPPYSLYTTSHGKYFKCVSVMPLQKNPILKSYNIQKTCLKPEFERIVQ